MGNFQAKLHEFGLSNTKFIADCYHLFDSVLPERFGKGTFGQIESLLRQIANAVCKSIFNKSCHCAMSTLQRKKNVMVT